MYIYIYVYVHIYICVYIYTYIYVHRVPQKDLKRLLQFCLFPNIACFVIVISSATLDSPAFCILCMWLSSVLPDISAREIANLFFGKSTRRHGRINLQNGVIIPESFTLHTKCGFISAFRNWELALKEVL